MSSKTSPKMSPAARQFIDKVIGLSTSLNAQTEADALVVKREAAQQQLLSLGLPTRKDEDWQYTSIQPLLQQDFRLSETVSTAELSLAQLEPFLPDFETIRLVFVDGEFSESLSAGFEYIPDGLSIEMADADAIQSIALPETADAFQWINELLLDQGLTIQLDAQIVLEVPLHILFVQTQSGTVLTPRLQVHLGEAAQCQLLQHFVCLADETLTWVNGVGQITLEAGATCKQVVLQDLSDSSFYFNHQTTTQATNSNFESTYLALGSQLSRHHSVAQQQGDAAETTQDSIVPGRDQQLLDTRTLTQHHALHGQSRQLHKMVLGDAARGVFAGMIEVAKGAQKTDGQMDIKSLLLSPQAKVDAKPQLEIYADDVKCSHGCAAGQIDEDQLFYAQARGIRRTDAMQLITQAFLLEPLEKFQVQPAMQAWLTQRVVDKL
ncbi:Fe-S cluster assembly protein SufD [Hydrogenovibrio sp. SC-1]|uniref:Fe-S cluster assembly protein SufD n=1 Tax=Hydrogenovibrio sp. SC-1 TaxID=2065820 RepID=UPI000C7DE7D4|nr:Fe-S cluster assembly protein SufD [Hydrogenovibrio sp. SC-1]PLA75157.1 Fe-S cluster assembly protein SufD [Hydrogenovibrio sp. SC-1]